MKSIILLALLLTCSGFFLNLTTPPFSQDPPAKQKSRKWFEEKNWLHGLAIKVRTAR